MTKLHKAYITFTFSPHPKIAKSQNNAGMIEIQKRLSGHYSYFAGANSLSTAMPINSGFDFIADIKARYADLVTVTRAYIHFNCIMTTEEFQKLSNSLRTEAKMIEIKIKTEIVWCSQKNDGAVEISIVADYYDQFRSLIMNIKPELFES